MKSIEKKMQNVRTLESSRLNVSDDVNLVTIVARAKNDESMVDDSVNVSSE